ncbi:replication initiation protein [Vibrio pectenicida]|nr:replication initiation protein [Vibrio pectenicida]
MDTLAHLPRCSDNKTAALVRPRDLAIRWPYVQVNRPDMVSWLVFDLDHDNPWVWQDTGLPTPNFIVSNPETGHAHLFYAIVPVCTSDAARRRPIEYMKAIYRAMASALNADPCYAGPVAKTPHHPAWRTTECHGALYELGELADSVELESLPSWASNEEQDTSHSRNCTLFHRLRHFAYSIFSHEKASGSYQDFFNRITNQAKHLNQFLVQGWQSNLPESEVKATVKSVARWTWENYTGECANRGVMRLDPSLPKAKRQSLAAKRTHQARQQGTMKAILEASEYLLNAGQAVTQAAIATLIGKTRQTVAKYQSAIDIVKQRPDIITLKRLLQYVNGHVKYAVSDIRPFLGGRENEKRSSGSLRLVGEARSDESPDHDVDPAPS